MKLLAIAAIAALTMTSQAYAFGNNHNNDNSNSNANLNYNSNHNSANALAAASSSSNSSSNSSARQGQMQGQGQGQGQVNGNSDNKQATTVNVGGDEARRIPVSTAYAPSINPTATCMGSSTAGGQGMSVGISMGSSWESENCMFLETARSFEQAGHYEDAMHVRCQTSYAKSAPSCTALRGKAAVGAKTGTSEDPYSAGYWK